MSYTARDQKIRGWCDMPFFFLYRRIVFATAMHSWVLGMCLGLNMGIAFGLFDSDKENKQEQE